MLIWIIIALGIAIVIILMAAAVKPDTVRYVRTATINASPERIVPLIDDFRAWRSWSPYEKLDPAMQRTYAGAERGAGAKYAWSGNKKAGAGSMEVMETSPHDVKLDLRFTRPFKNECITRFSLTPQGGTTHVTWAMEGRNLFAGKVMGLFMDFDKMIGKDFEQGLADLKRVAER